MRILYHEGMARTVRIDPNNRRSWASVEKKWARKQTNRLARVKARQALRTEQDFDSLVLAENPSTSGWVTH